MKKAIFVLVLILTMISSITAGTLAMYTVSIDNLAEGSVVAKEFIFLGEGTDTFQHGIKIAPSETVRWQFKVKNFKDHILTETDLYYKLSFHIFASTGKQAIEPLTVTVKDLNGNIMGTAAGVGSFDVLGSFPLMVSGQEKDYVLEIHWPDNGMNDIMYAGGNYGTTVNVDAIASQIPLSSTPDPGNPPPNQVSVRYATSVPWQNGQSNNYEYEYKITITNNSSTPIKDWYINFTLHNDRLINAWSNAKLVSYSPPNNTYKFVNPSYNNTATDDILPGQSVTFRGPARGMGTTALHSISVGGSNVSGITNVGLITEFGKVSLD